MNPAFLCLQGRVAIAPCLIGEGYEYYKCNPTTSVNTPSWHTTVNVSECIRKNFLEWKRKVSILPHFFYLFPSVSNSALYVFTHLQIVENFLENHFSQKKTLFQHFFIFKLIH